MRRRESSAAQLANLLALLAGLQIIRWILDLLNEISSLSADSDYVLAGLFFLTVFWGFAMSGENLTGTKANSALYPRDGRILLSVSSWLPFRPRPSCIWVRCRRQPKAYPRRAT